MSQSALWEGQASFPMSPPTDAQADAAMVALASDFSALIREGAWSSRSETPGRLNLFVDLDASCNAASDRFHWGARMACDALASPSPLRSWFDPKIKRSVESSKFYATNPRAALALRKYIPAQFRPTAAAALFSHFRATSIYDPCGGWGDRLAAALAHRNVRSYMARDVNPAVFAGYAQQIARYDTERRAAVYLIPAETAPFPAPFADFVFTSPPYYKIEKYAGALQSWAVHKGFDEWMQGFLFEMVRVAWGALLPGGIMALNIADAYADHRVNRIVTPLSEWAPQNLARCSFAGTMGYRIAGRINHRNKMSGIQCEPILVFQKGTSTCAAPSP